MHKYLLLLTAIITACSSHNPYEFVDTSSSKTYRPRPSVRTQPKTTQTLTKYYSVKKGDTLSSISRMSGLSVTSIKKYNQLRSNTLSVGQKIYLPGVKTMKSVPKITAPVMSSSVKIIRRSQWAKHSLKGNISPMGAIKKITVHHTDDAPNLNKMSDIKFIQSIENYHRNERKWAAIGYHFIIGRDGKIYEGRPLKYQGAHASGNNPNNAGISLIGDFNHRMPSTAQMRSLTSLLATLRKTHKIPASKVYGHTHLGQTQCPGKKLKSWLERYRRQ